MRTAHGPDLKIGSRADYLAALESYMLTGSSPQDAIAKVGSAYGITISKTTCYRYIRMSLFQTLRYKHLPQGQRATICHTSPPQCDGLKVLQKAEKSRVQICASKFRTGIFHHKSNNYLLTSLRKASNFARNP